jgi:hypothetical protein
VNDVFKIEIERGLGDYSLELDKPQDRDPLFRDRWTPQQEQIQIYSYQIFCLGLQ